MVYPPGFYIMEKRHLLFVILIVVIIFTVSTLKIKVMRIYDGDNNEGDYPILYQTTVGSETDLVLKWKHSVTKQYVIEKFRINSNNGFDVIEMIFNEHGPNLPNGPEFGTKWEVKDGYFRVYNYNLTFEELPVRIGQVIAKHLIIFKGNEILLNQLDEPGGYVIIRIQDVTLFEFMKEVGKIWLKNIALKT